MSVYLKSIFVFLVLIGSTTPGALADDLGYGDSYARYIRDSDAKRDYRRKRERDRERRDDKRALKEERQEIDQHKDDYKKDYISDFVDTDFHKSRYGLDHLRDRLKDRKDSDRDRDKDRDRDRDSDRHHDDDDDRDDDDSCFDDADYSYISDKLEKRLLEKRDDKEWKDLTTPIPGMLHDWVPARVDRLHNGAFEKEPDNGFPVPYRLNGHLDIQRKLPWDKDAD